MRKILISLLFIATGCAHMATMDVSEGDIRSLFVTYSTAYPKEENDKRAIAKAKEFCGNVRPRLVNVGSYVKNGDVGVNAIFICEDPDIKILMDAKKL